MSSGQSKSTRWGEYLGPFLAVLTAAVVGVWYVVRVLPDPLLRARIGLAKAQDTAIQASDRAVRPFIIPSAGWQAARATIRQLVGIFQR